MIVTVLLDFANFFLQGLLSLLPVGNLPLGIPNGILYFWGILNSFSYVFPVSTLFLALLFVLGFDVGVMLWHVLQWIIRKIPGMS